MDQCDSASEGDPAARLAIFRCPLEAPTPALSPTATDGRGLQGPLRRGEGYSESGRTKPGIFSGMEHPGVPTGQAPHITALRFFLPSNPVLMRPHRRRFGSDWHTKYAAKVM